MKRSEINQIIALGDDFFRQHQFYLPPFAHWSLDEWKEKKASTKEIIETGLGWDITDFGSGEYQKKGLFIFTIRNGSPKNWEKLSGKLYAEKIMIVDVEQVTPMHFHWSKMEDIINRGGGKLAIQLYNSTAEGDLDFQTPVNVSLDGILHIVLAGGIIKLEPGESISLTQGCYHTFWGEGEKVLVGEVSLVNDDHKDNRFHQPVGRFPDIEEDVVPIYLLCNDYAKFL